MDQAPITYRVPHIPGAGPSYRSKPGSHAVIQVITEEAQVKLADLGYSVEEPHVCIFTGTEVECEQRIETARSIIGNSEVDVEGVSFVVVPTSDVAVA
jgi:hypothetical protein